MKGDKKVVEQLNLRLADELAAINQYMVHSEMCTNWGYHSLAKIIKKRAIEEMEHAEMLIERIIFLEGVPTMTKLGFFALGKDANEIITNDHESEDLAIESYNESIVIAKEAKDQGTVKIFEKILSDEEKHIGKVEEHQSLIDQLGLKNFLIEQV
jgi:bacterioferritin